MIDKIYSDELARLLDVREADLPELVAQGALPASVPDLGLCCDCRPCWSKAAALDCWSKYQVAAAIQNMRSPS